jgi:hypothetical protein
VTVFWNCIRYAAILATFYLTMQAIRHIVREELQAAHICSEVAP